MAARVCPGISISGNVRETFYIDDMKLVKGEFTGVEVSEERGVPRGHSLSQNYPNPFNPITAIAYDLPEANHITLTVYTLTGQKVAVLVDAHQEAGHHGAVFDGSGHANGIYLYKLETGSFMETKRMVLIR